ncbi:butyrophilin-like protein 10 [Eschrichtius robustus]|uniref:butyrophilin-like protein 10 n=1 Tax=Eschrichtius robustus TaxID=9764 RepID=UPI0035C07EAB
MVGEDAELPCYLSPDISAEDMELRWYTDQPTEAVHVHRKGEDVQQEHLELYRGRTTFVRDHMAQSQAAVIIHNVTTFDNGTFHCQFNSTMSEEAMLWLRVAGLGMEPIIRVQVDQDEGDWAECTSAAWYAEPQVEWRDFRGHTLPSVINLSASPTTGLWTVVSNVTLQYGAVKGLSCPIFNPLLLEKKVDKIDLPAPHAEFQTMV